MKLSTYNLRLIAVIQILVTTSNCQKCAENFTAKGKYVPTIQKLASSTSWFVQGTNRADWDCIKFEFIADPFNNNNGILNYTASFYGKQDTSRVYLIGASPGQFQLSYTQYGPPVTTLTFSQIYKNVNFDTVLVFDCSAQNNTVYYILHNKIGSGINSSVLAHYEQLIKNKTNIDVRKKTNNFKIGDQCLAMTNTITIQKLSKRRRWYVQLTNSQLKNCIEFTFVVDPIKTTDGFLVYTSYNDNWLSDNGLYFLKYLSPGQYMMSYEQGGNLVAIVTFTAYSVSEYKTESFLMAVSSLSGVEYYIVTSYPIVLFLPNIVNYVSRNVPINLPNTTRLVTQGMQCNLQ